MLMPDHLSHVIAPRAECLFCPFAPRTSSGLIPAMTQWVGTSAGITLPPNFDLLQGGAKWRLSLITVLSTHWPIIFAFAPFHEHPHSFWGSPRYPHAPATKRLKVGIAGTTGLCTGSTILTGWCACTKGIRVWILPLVTLHLGFAP